MHRTAVTGNRTIMASTRTTSHPPAAASFGRDQSLALLRRGYLFWDHLRARDGAEIVRARLLHERATAVRGAAAAQRFYEQPDTERSSALPKSLVKPLFGAGAVHTLDGHAHAHRKAMFNARLDATAVHAVVQDVSRAWDEAAPHWLGEVDVFTEIAEMLFRAGCRWVGLDARDAARRTHDMLALIDGFGAPSTRQLRARAARRRTNAWVAEHVQQARRSPSGRLTPVDAVAAHRDTDGNLLDERTAAVEIINLVRPLVAVSWLVSGMAHAYDEEPKLRADVLSGAVTPMEMAQEVRRTTPFVPFLATRPVRDLVWQGVPVPRGTLLVLDVWGTNHDPASWSDPEVFDPLRFRTTPVTPYNLVPQGGGDRHTGHRCPGEDLTLAVLMAIAPRLAAVEGSVVDRQPGLRRMPPRPHCAVRVAA
jgi:fatty-acid peroxygenase